MERYREVVIFVAGMMTDSRPFLQHVYEMQVEPYLKRMRTDWYSTSIDADLFKWLQVESSVLLVDHPLHNKYINYYNHDEDERKKRPSDTTPVYYPSRLYHFWFMKHEVVLENHLTESTEIPPCAMYIEEPREAVRDSLLSICSQISTHQPVTDLRMVGVTCNSLEAPRLAKTQSVILGQCVLPEHFLMKILRQLLGCGETLQSLSLYNMDLKPHESFLDELLEDLVAHHEAGLPQRKLILNLGYNNLSEEFVEKWSNRCEKVDSINCMIDR